MGPSASSSSVGVACAVGMALVTVRSAAAEPDGLDNLLGPREIAVGEAMRGGATGASAIGTNPAGLPLNRELVFEGGYGYRASDSASIVGVSACDSTNPLPGCFFYDYASSSPEIDGMAGSRRMHVAGLALSRPILPRVFIGTTTKYYDFESTMTGDKDASGFVVDVGATLRLTQLISAGLVANNLYATERSSEFPRALGGGVLARPIPSLTATFDMRWKIDGEATRARYGGGVELFLKSGQSGFPLRVGGVRDNSTGAEYVSGGLGYASMKWSFDVGGRHQLSGGDETVVLASMRFYGPRMAAANFDGPSAVAGP